MPKKRKLGSINPIYIKVEENKEDVVITKRHECDAAIRDSSGNVVPGIKAPVYSIWSKKNDE